MSRIRSVHPGFFRDEDLVGCSAFARLLYIGLGVEADDKGIFEWKPLQLKMTLFPADNVDVALLLAELINAGNVRQFDVGGKAFGAIRNFRKYQRPKTPNDIHPMPREIAEYVAFPQKEKCTELTTSHFPQKGENAPQMEDGGGKREEEKNISLEAEREFEEWYAVFPKHVGKGQARRSYRAAKRKTSSEVLLAGAHKAAAAFATSDPRFIPHPATWLNGERWLDADRPPGEPQRERYDWDADPANRGVH